MDKITSKMTTEYRFVWNRIRSILERPILNMYLLNKFEFTNWIAVNDEPRNIDKKYNNLSLSLNHNLILSRFHQCFLIWNHNWQIEIEIRKIMNINDKMDKIRNVWSQSLIFWYMLIDRNTSESKSNTWNRPTIIAEILKKSLTLKYHASIYPIMHIMTKTPITCRKGTMSSTDHGS